MFGKPVNVTINPATSQSGHENRREDDELRAAIADLLQHIQALREAVQATRHQLAKISEEQIHHKMMLARLQESTRAAKGRLRRRDPVTGRWVYTA